jgi:hypothetical protein
MKNVQLLLTCILISFVTMNFSCQKEKDGYHSYYVLKNQTPHPLYSDWNFDSTEVGGNYPLAVDPATTKCEASSDRKFGYRDAPFEYSFEHSAEHKLYIYIYDAQVVETTNWDTVRKNRLYLARFVYSREQMDSLDWNIFYR